jgi:aryl-alcohol dehydrogenase-like predicted oxidoreductase
VPAAGVSDILRRASAAGIDTLDTAISYGDSEECLGRAGVSGWRVVTKLPPLPSDEPDVCDWVRRELEGSLRRLGVSRVEALLVHRSADLGGPVAAEYVRGLEMVKKAGLVRAIGVSVYGPGDLETVWRNLRPDVIQAPLNVLDRRIVRSGWLAKLVDQGVRLHARSAFLQGLLLMPAERRPAWFQKWSGLLDRWLSWCRENGVSPLRAALAFSCSQPGVERVVVGVDSPAQLEEILAAKTIGTPCPPADLYSDDVDLVEPSRWVIA